MNNLKEYYVLQDRWKEDKIFKAENEIEAARLAIEKSYKDGVTFSITRLYPDYYFYGLKYENGK